MQHGRKTIVVYPGRFQPMLPHHVEVLHRLAAEYGDEVYVATTDKVDPSKNNFFTFAEKKQIATTMYDINPDHILQVKNPYNGAEYAEGHFSDDATRAVLLFAVGEKDMQEDPRFPKEPNKRKKNGELAYLQLLDGFDKGVVTMDQHAFVVVAPTVEVDGETASASAFRKAFTGAQDDQHAKEVFEKFFGSYNESIFRLVNEKIRGPQSMNESLNDLRKLAGILNESAPVDFGGEEDAGNGTGMAREYDYEEIARMAENAVFVPPSESSKKSSIANRIDGDPNDPKAKGDAIMSALSSGAGASVLGEINERLDPNHDNQMLLSSYIGELVDKLNDGIRLGNFPADQQQIVAKLAVSAAKRMDLEKSSEPDEEFDENDEIDRVVLDEGVPKYMQLFDDLGVMIGRAIQDSGVTDELAEYLEEKGLGAGEPARERLYRSHPGFALFLDTLIETADIRVYTPAIRDELDRDDYVGESDEKPDFADIDDDGDTEEPMKKAAKDKEEVDESFDDLEEPSEVSESEADLLRRLAGL